MTAARKLPMLIAICLVSLTSAGQCLTDFAKLVPEPTPDYTTGFGSSISVHNDLLAIGAPASDSLGESAGIAYIYQRQMDDSWKKIATVAPSDPQTNLSFGVSIKLSANYLAVGASGFGGRVYVFKRPASGWAATVENYKISVTGSVGLASSPIDPIDISDDERTIAIVDQYKSISFVPARSGVIHVFHRQASDEWSDHAPFTILSPEGHVTDFGRAGVHIIADRIVTGTPLSLHPYGTIYIYRDPSGEFSNPNLEARLTVNASQGTNGLFSLGSLAVFDDGILSAAPTYLNIPGGGGLAFFRKPDGNVWADSEPTCVYRTNISRVDMLTGNGTDIFARFNSGASSRFGVIRRGPGGWCNATVEIIKTIPGGTGDVLGPYASRITASGSNVVTGMAASADNPEVQIGLEAFHKNGSSWSPSLLFESRKTTAGHSFGRTVLSHDNHLFVGAIRDGTTKPNTGAVYIYKKQGTTWTKTGKILPSPVTKYDDIFGSSLAINKTQLAVGALGFEPHGKIFIYNKTGNDWNNPVLAQEIELPGDLNTDFYGDNLAMNDDWLVIPYTFTNPFRIKIAIYRKASTRWEYNQSVDIQNGNIFIKQMTVAVDIDGETIVAGGAVVQRNTQGLWQITALLTPSDPEPIKIAPDFTHLITNGSSFGYSVDIEGDNIFIGAPQKDYGSTWDVGAVYVYAKQPGRAWSNMHERTRIVPRVKDEGELFGYSLDALENTLVVGAPGEDLKKDGVTARDKAGRSYVFQAMDYYWEHVTPLLDLTGDAFAKDYFGISVSLDGDNFITGASIDDLPTGELSGSVYVTPSPPIVRLVPPTCVSYPEVALFGYPFGGTWSGPALTDATGKFSPAVAGVGLHEFEYTTASCTYTGKLLIEVLGPVSLTPITPSEIVVCKGPAISVPLAITSDAGANYQWYYRAPDATQFDVIGEHGPTMTANSIGEYYVEVFNAGCSSDSPTINIHYEDIEVEADPPAGCIQPSTVITLAAEPPGGVWSGAGVSGSKFSQNLPGTYPVTYTYTSAINCAYTDVISIEVMPVFVPAIVRGAGNLCERGTVALSVGNAPLGASFDWLYKSNLSPSFESLKSPQKEIVATENGSYVARVEDKGCQSESAVFALDDQLKVDPLPGTDKIDVCFGSETTLSTTAPPGSVVSWNFTPSGDETPVVVQTAATYLASKGGYYFAEVSKGKCFSATTPVLVVMLAKDTVRAPNVFTPNGDGMNDSFSVSIGSENREMTIFNRSGTPIFQNRSGGAWDGGDHPSGVYFWTAVVPGCGEDRRINGFVHLLRQRE